VTFQKGQSGNPAGRPKGEPTITPWLRRLLLEKHNGTTRAELVASRLIQMAQDGDAKAIALVLERIDGKVPDQVDLTSDGQAFSFSIQRAHADRDD
jgi:hypothetical protein